MIDIHSHILFNLDDGPKTKEESMNMLKTAASEGITDIISTSHAFHPQYNVPAQKVIEQVNQLQRELNNLQIPLTIHLGHEVRLNDKLVELCKSGQIHKLANSDYLLLELPSNSVPHYTKNIVNSLIAEGITPIIAHPERNKGIAEKPERLERLIREGAVAQITAGSVAGHFGRAVQKLSIDLVRANLVHTYGSDVHNHDTRPFLFEKGLAYLEKQKLLDSVNILLENNKRILRNIPLELFEPEEVKKKKWWNILKF
ncbi:tyrosine-protein phosphatase [Ureibacillus sp. MALMAid1270]|uniref:tyrosine-protein phosphatase n=1 Tax=Ureibacillus sp. MALMAid1270 TaxID=3411629 RepID=UPI003BA414F1